MSDPNYSSVSLLLHFDGADGSTTFTDNSPTPKTITANGNAQITTTDPKFGSGSVTFDGTGDYLNTLSDSAFDLAGVSFTVECFFNPSNVSQNYKSLFSQRISAVYAPFEVRVNTTGVSWLIANATLNFWASTSVSASSLFSANTWNHIALVGDGTTITLYVNGTSRLTVAQPSWVSANRIVYIGSGGDGAYAGKIDEFRITKGVARYTANFTPPTAAFPNFGPSVARAADPGPLGSPSVLALVEPRALASDPGPLGSELMLAQQWAALVSAPSMLGEPNPLAWHLFARAEVPTMLGSANLLAWHLFARASVPSMLGAATPLATHDFTLVLGDATTYYVMDLTTPSGMVRVPISSWQATLQTGLSNYVQCVVPAVSAYVSAINASTEFVVSRLVAVPGLGNLVYEMARAPVQTTTFDQGPYNYTCTISGYSSGFAPDENPSAAYNRTLQNIRSISINQGGTRVRCSIDWLLRPSHRVFASAEEFIVAYINYYVGGNDAYMEVGERA